jgi:pimeloyl-ACP methyl ester carboxylesterase
VVAYDRADTGQSPWDDQPPTPQRANQRLKKLIDALGVTSPFIVGHSRGRSHATSPQIIRSTPA